MESAPGGPPVIVRDYWRLSHPDAPRAANYGTRERCEEMRERLSKPGFLHPDRFLIEPFPCCACCGDVLLLETWADNSPPPWRCAKHTDRNPCLVDGCKRTRSAIGSDGQIRLGDDQSICSTHWRRFVPPGSRTRRTYHAFFRQAKKHGWGPRKGKPRLDWRFRRFWDSLVRMVRRRAEGGHLDEAEINKLMGW